jgi:hypothetical protein
MDLHLYGKVAIVTGASKRIGLAITEALAAEGACRSSSWRVGGATRRGSRATVGPVRGPLVLVLAAVRAFAWRVGAGRGVPAVGTDEHPAPRRVPAPRRGPNCRLAGWLRIDEGSSAGGLATFATAGAGRMAAESLIVGCVA